MLKKTCLIILLVVTFVLAGCSSQTTTAQTTSSSAQVSSTTAASTTATSTSVVTPSSTTSAAVTYSLKIGSLPRIYDIIAYAAEQEGIYKAHGLSVEVVSFRSEVEKDNAMLTGNLDGVIEGSYGAVNLNKDQETSKLVGHSLMSRMFNVIVSPASGITTPAGLKGKEIATSTGTIMDYALDNLLVAQGLSIKDVTLTNVPNMPLRLEMMSQGKIPAALFTSPLSDQAVANGNILLLDDSKNLLGGPGLIFSTQALKDKPEAIQRYIDSWQEAVKAINANPEKFRSLIVTGAKVPDAIAATYQIPVFPQLGLPSEADLNKIIIWMKAQGLVTQDVPYNKAIDTKYIK
jgi:NitT/TauT family transport system substrate-binding protein